MGFLAGDYTPHPNSFYFNVLPVFWPCKVFWFFRKTSEIILLKDFPAIPEGHPDEQMPRKYFSFSFKH